MISECRAPQVNKAGPSEFIVGHRVDSGREESPVWPSGFLA